MALKPTIYKFRIALTDLNRDYYDSLNLTIAQHPSENLNRMMARVLAYCMNAQPELAFTKGLSTIEEPDIWLRELNDTISLWIDVGEPDPDRVKKSERIADKVLIYSYNTKSGVWWKQNAGKLNLPKVQVFRFDAPGIDELTHCLSRTMDMSVMISGSSLFINTENGDCEVTWEELKA